MMTPEQKLMREILLLGGELTCDEITEATVGELYERLVDEGRHWDSKDDIRYGKVETGIDPPTSRHYESKSVAMETCDGSWVGWTYWYGGGKHGEPGAVGWMDRAYDVSCEVEEKLVVVRTFTRIEPRGLNPL